MGAGSDQLFGGAGFDVIFGEGGDDFISDFGGGDTVNFGAGDGATPNQFRHARGDSVARFDCRCKLALAGRDVAQCCNIAGRPLGGIRGRKCGRLAFEQSDNRQRRDRH